MTTKTTTAMAAGSVGLPRTTAIAAPLTFIALPCVATLPFTAPPSSALATTLPALIPTAAGWTRGLIRSLWRARIARGAMTIVGGGLGRGLT